MSADSLILLNGLLRTKFWGGFLRLRFAMAGLRGTSGSSFFFSDVSTAPQGEVRHRVGREGCCRSMQKGKSRSASDAYLVGPGSFPQTYQQNCENRMGAGLSRGRGSAGGSRYRHLHADPIRYGTKVTEYLALPEPRA